MKKIVEVESTLLHCAVASFFFFFFSLEKI